MTTAAPTPTLDPDASAEAPPAPPAAPVAPPLPWLLAYRVFGLRLPEAYGPWVARDVASRMFLTWRMGRTYVWYLALIGLYSLAQSLIYVAPTKRLLLRLALAALALALMASGKTLVRRTLRWQRIDKRARPVAPKGLAVLDNQHALVLGVALLVLFTGASSVFAHTRRPETRCEKPDGEALDRVRLGLKNPRTELGNPQQLTFGDRRLISANVKVPDQTERIWIWIVEPAQVYELRTAEQAPESPTTFSELPRTRVDRALGPAIQRMVQCLGIGTGGRGRP